MHPDPEGMLRFGVVAALYWCSLVVGLRCSEHSFEKGCCFETQVGFRSVG